MNRIRVIAVVFMLSTLALAGCGQKGPLYRETPEENAQAEAVHAPLNEYAGSFG